MNPKLSAWEQLFGVFDYNATPLGPPGTRVLVHDKPSETARASLTCRGYPSLGNDHVVDTQGFAVIVTVFL
jgi:hypothetical protein